MSTLRVNTIQNSGGTGSPEINGLARAWVNFNGTGTVAIRASSNVTSITDGGVGVYTVNFTTALPDTNYSVVGTVEIQFNVASGFIGPRAAGYSTSSVLIETLNGAGSSKDCSNINIAVFR